MADAVAPPSVDDFLGLGSSANADTDAAIRTVYGEAANQPAAGQQAVAATIINRARATGHPITTVVAQPNQYQAWQDSKLAAKMRGLSPSDPDYQEISNNIAPVLSGQVKLPYTQYLNRSTTPPNASALKTWADKPGEKIGDHEFYAHANTASPAGSIDDFLNGTDAHGSASTPSTDTFLKSVGGAPKDSAPDVPQADSGSLTDKFLHSVSQSGRSIGDPSIARVKGGPDQGAPLTQAQQDFVVSRRPDENAPEGSKYNPYALRKGGPLPQNHGDYYITLDGELKQVGLTPAEQESYERISKEVSPNNGPSNALVNGMMQGYSPEVAGAIQQGVSGLTGKNVDIDAHMRRMITAERLSEFRQKNPILNALLTDAGSFTSAGALTEGLGAGLNATRIPQALGPAGEFLSGQAGATAGPGAGNALLRAGSRTAQNALQGAAFGGESAHLNPNESVAENIGGGALGGAAVGGLAAGARGAGRFLGERFPQVPEAVRSFTQPLSQTGREAIADNALRTAAAGGPTTIDANELVPGSRPTLAQATGNAGLKAAEVSVRGSGGNATNVFTDIQNTQDAARQRFLEGIQGDKTGLDDLIEARRAAADPVRAKIFASAKPTDATPVLNKIDEILASPSGKSGAVRKVLGEVRENLFNANGDLETNPEHLYGVRKDLNEGFSPEDKSAKQAANRELQQVKGSLDDVIEKGAPGFKDHIEKFAEDSGPIGEKKFLLGRDLTDASGTTTLAKIDRTIKAIDQANLKPGVSNGKSVGDDTYNALVSLRDDLRRADLMPDRRLGSNTYQKLGSNALLAKAGIPSALASVKVPPLAWAHNALTNLYERQNPKIQDILAQKLANPEYGATAFQPPSVNPSNPQSPLFPGMAGSYVNHLVGDRRKPKAIPIPATP